MTRTARRIRSFPLLLPLLVAVAGCDSPSLPSLDFDWVGVKAPVVQVESVEPAEQTDEGARVEMLVELVNPNEVALPLIKTSYTVDVDGAGSFSFEDEVKRTLPARGRQTVRIPAALATRGGLNPSAGYRVNGSVSYELPGEIPALVTESGLPYPSVGFASEGELQ